MDEVKKVIIVVLDGYSASTRKVSLKDVIYTQLQHINKNFDIDYDNVVFRYESAKFSNSKRGKITKFLKSYNDPNNILLFIGKSYGAKVANKIFNSIRLDYDKTFLVTIDPCWPKFFNWTPNCNADTLFFKNIDIDEILNIYLIADKNEQCGCPVYTMYKDIILNNFKLMKHTRVMGKEKKYNHRNIINSPIVANVIYSFLMDSFKEGMLLNAR